MGREIRAFIDYLDAERGHVLGILDGLSDPDLRRPVLPSGWSSLELVRHLTVDVERFWFQGVIAGDAEVADQLRAGAKAHWHVPDGTSADDVFADYRAEIRRANSVLDTLGRTERALDQEPAAWPVEIWPNWRLPDVRNVLLHALTELSCHAGHLDATRELIDGKTWLGGDPY
jgi:hypothetical protein